jgi:hypothetical protein
MPDILPPLPGETLMAYLQRTRPDYTWLDADGTVEPYAVVETPYPWAQNAYVRCRLQSWEFDAYVAQLFPTPPAVRVPPVWPGAGSVTLGEPVAIGPSVTLAGPLSGVLVEVTNSPGGLGKFLIGDRVYWYRLGFVSFASDSGEVEPWQYLGWDRAIYTPRTMMVASVAFVRGLAGAEGTVTPWLMADS